MILFIDRKTGKKEVEKVYGGRAIDFLYGDSLISALFLHPLSRLPFFSALFGFWQRLPITRHKITSFVQDFDVDVSEFEKPVEQFSCFDDFFVRKLKRSSRPIAAGKNRAVIPADGRYWFYEKISSSNYFNIKGEKFDLAKLLEDDDLAKHYYEGSMAIARLCPSDYHRFHFPCDGVPSETKLINGWLYSVNPAALKKDLQIFTKNKRTLCQIESEVFGKVLFMEIGATSVGTIHQTYQPFRGYEKGDEKGYFSFGASSLVILFEPDRIQFDSDLLEATRSGYEMRCLMGQSMGMATDLSR